MSHRSRKHKKKFPCTHRGYGNYCHRCASKALKKKNQQTARQQQRQQWQSLFEKDPIDLSQLPKQIVKKTRHVLQALNTGIEYWQVSGKRLNAARNVIRIPITRRYRLICRDDGDELTPLEVLSHEDYNPISRRFKRQLARWFSRGSAKH